MTLLVSFQLGFAAATGDSGVETDGLGRPLWEPGVLWIKVKPTLRVDRNQLELQNFDVPSLDEKISRFGIEEIRRSFRPIERPGRTDLPDLTRIFTLKLPRGASENGIMQAFQEDPNVQYAERVPAAYQEAVPNDEYYATVMYHLPQIHAEEAWDIHKGEDGVEQIVVGICDTGVDWNHPDLGANIYNRLGEDADGDGATLIWDGTNWVMDPDDLNGIDDDNNGYIDDLIGWNMMANANGDQNNDPMDPPNRGHGSHVSGLAAGVTNNEIGIASISWNVKVFGTSHGYEGDNGTSVYNAYDGLVYLADNGADIINASWGGGGYSQGAEEVIRYITGVGALFVSSAGNSDSFVENYPSSYPGAISVASVDRNDEKAWYSTWGWSVDVATPGGNHEPGLISTVPYGNGYDYYSGTSMASPVTAGLFALVKSYHPDWTNDQLINQVLGTTDGINALNPDYSGLLGSGRVNAFAALSETDVHVQDKMELVLWDVQSSNPVTADGVMSPGDSTTLSLLLRSYTHILGDSSVTFSLTSTDPDVMVSPATLQDTIFPDDYSHIDGFHISIAEDADTELSTLWLVIQPQTAQVVTGDSIPLPIMVNTVSLATSFLDLDLTFGDRDTSLVTLTNSAATPVPISAYAQNLDPASLLWHVDDFQAFDGSSWWCGNPGLGGYPDQTIQFMDLPILDLTGSSNPVLTFMADWYIEDPTGADAPYDGWDGANVWVSTDAGASFEIMEPVSPAYDATALYSWGEIWGYGLVPGWAGHHNGYEEATFDLSAYATDDVVIRFGFASDGAVHDVGFFVDNIMVNDDASIFFENDGQFGGGIQVSGFPANIVQTPWLEFPNADASIPGNGSLDLQVVTNTRDLTPGSYSSTAYVAFEGIPIGDVNVSLNLSAPEDDLYLRDYHIAHDGFRILRSDALTAEVENTGMVTESSFRVALTLGNADGVIFTDTVSVDSLEAGQTGFYTFAPFFPVQGELLDLTVELLDNPGDYNVWNDMIQSSEEVSNLVDTFAEENEFWIMDGWGITSGIIGVTDIFSAHVDAGTMPYSPNLDNTMAYYAPIDLSLIDNLAVVYWTISQTEQDVDVMTFEVSTDGTNWDILRSHSGNATFWVQHAVDVSDYIAAGNEQLWFRFHFVSNESGSGMGIFVDDVELHTVDYLSTDTAALPREFALQQNFPNPFNPTTTLRYALPQGVGVNIQVFDVRGRLVNTLVDTRQPAGVHEVQWNARDASGNPLGTGMYFARIQAGEFNSVVKMLYLK